ncbi:expressed unknown protein (Partial), partial [Seminavis robusta]|eukprot:Sro2282_g321860.1 n/a (365) ;mRNA; f:15220-16314
MMNGNQSHATNDDRKENRNHFRWLWMGFWVRWQASKWKLSLPRLMATIGLSALALPVMFQSIRWSGNNRFLLEAVRAFNDDSPAITKPHHRAFLLPDDYNSHGNDDEEYSIQLYTYLVSPPREVPLFRLSAFDEEEFDGSRDLQLHRNFRNYFYSALRNGYRPPIIIRADKGKKAWKDGQPEYLRWQVRMEQYLQVAQQAQRNGGNKSLLMFSDSLDVIVISPVQQISSAFQRIAPQADKAILCAEPLCDTVYCKTDMAAKQFVDQQAPSRKNKFRYLNAGVILGTPQTLVSIFKWVLPYMKEHRVDDQAALVKFWQHNPNKITRDYESEICGIISPVPQFLARDWDYSPLIEGLLDSSADHATR